MYETPQAAVQVEAHTGDISVDHSPELPREAERIKHAGGLIMQLGPILRVVHPDTSREGLRGLAMTRSFGDFWAREIGVVPEPDIYIHDIVPGDRYIVCASDGIWDMLSIKEVAAGLPADAEELSKNVYKIVENAIGRWKKQGMEADDISLCVVAV